MIVGKIRMKFIDLKANETGESLSLHWSLKLLYSFALYSASKYYPTGVDGVVFVVYANDRSHYAEAKTELEVPSADLSSNIFSFLFLQTLLSKEELKNVPFLILGNKIDRETAPTEEELRLSLGLTKTFGKEISDRGRPVPTVRPVELFMCSVVRKVGYGEGKSCQDWPWLYSLQTIVRSSMARTISMIELC